MIHVEFMVVGPVSTNCYFLVNDELKEVAIVDPGDRADKIKAYIAKEGLKPVAILLTHGHFDHILAVNALKDLYPQIKVYACTAEKDLLETPAMNCSSMVGRICSVEADVFVADQEQLEIAGM